MLNNQPLDKEYKIKENLSRQWGTQSRKQKFVEKQTKRKQGFGAFLKKMEAERSEHLMMSRFPWKEGDMEGLCGRADSLIRKARIDGIGSTITMAKKGKNPAQEARRDEKPKH